MNHPKANPPTPLIIPKAAKPRHKQSFIGTLGSLTRSVADSLRGPKSIAIGLFVAAIALPTAKYALTENTSQSQVDSTSNRTVQSTSNEENSASPQPVTLHTAKLATVETVLTLTGTVVPESLLRITPSLSGVKILEMRVQPGDRIAPGQILAVLDNRILLSQLAQAEAQLAQAESTVRSQEAAIAQAQVIQQAATVDVSRYTALYEQGAISQEQLDSRQITAFTAQQNVEVAIAALGNAQATIASRQAAIQQIKTQLNQTIVTAPTAGTIAERRATIGETAAATTPLYSLIEDDQLILEVNPSQAQLEKIELNAPVRIRATSQNSQVSHIGSVKSIDPTLEASSRKATVQVALSGSGPSLRPGMFLQAELVTHKRRSVIVPATAVITQANGESIVYTAKKTAKETAKETAGSATYTAAANTVTTAPYSASSTEHSRQPSSSLQILSGLTEGDRIITSGASYLQPGDPITPIP